MANLMEDILQCTDFTADGDKLLSTYLYGVSLLEMVPREQECQTLVPSFGKCEGGQIWDLLVINCYSFSYRITSFMVIHTKTQ